jgi:hypothetical protein
MADLPIWAYREPLGRRLARWGRRHKALVHGGIAVLAITTLGLAVAAGIVSREKQITQEARKQAEDGAVTAQAHLQRAIDASYRLYSLVADEKLEWIPGPPHEISTWITAQTGLRFRAFVKMRPDDPDLVRRSAWLSLSTGAVRSRTGDFLSAREFFSAAIEGFESLASITQTRDPQHRLRLAVAIRDMASFLHDNGHDREAEPYFQKAVSLTDELFDSFDDLTPPSQKELRSETGWLAVKVGDAERDRGDLEQADRSYRRASELLTPAIQAPDASYGYRLVFCEARLGLGMIARERKQSEAERELALAERIARGVLKDAAAPDPRAELARTLVIRWDGSATAPDHGALADAGLDEAVALFDMITKQFPEITVYRRDRAWALLVRAGRHAAAGRAEGAERDLTEAQRVLSALMAKERENGKEALNWSYPGLCGQVEVALARLRLQQGRADQARELRQQGIGHLQFACKNRPQHVGDRQSLDEARQLVIEKATTTRSGEVSRP